MTSDPKVIYYCSSGRLAAWAASLHLGGPDSELDQIHPVYHQWKLQHRPGGIELIGHDDLGLGIYAWQVGQSHAVLTRAFRGLDEIFSKDQKQWFFVDSELPGIRRLGMVAMMNAFTNYGDREIFRWARPHLRKTVLTTMQTLRGWKS